MLKVIFQTEKKLLILVLTYIQNIKKECETNKTLNSPYRYTDLAIEAYILDSGIKGSCSGNSEGFIIANPLNSDYLPTWKYSPKKGTITCSYDTDENSFFLACKKEGQLERFKSKLSEAFLNNKVLENKFYERGNSRYVVVEGDTWEKAQLNAEELGGNLATINDKDENEFIKNELFGVNKVSDKLEKKFRIPDEPLRGTSIWLGHINKGQDTYESISGDKEIYSNWAPGEYSDGIGKNEKYTMFTLFDNYNRDPGMVGTVSNRQFNTQALRERGGAHLFYGLAEIKFDD